jgi:hypothetical protein
MPREYVRCNFISDKLGEVEVDGWVHYEIDRNYGEDADWHRGCLKFFITEVADVSAYDIETDDEVELMPNEYELAAQELADHFELS